MKRLTKPTKRQKEESKETTAKVELLKKKKTS